MRREIPAALRRQDAFNASRRGIRANGAGSAPDPDFANVSLLLPFDGSDGETSTIDKSDNDHLMTFAGSARIEQDQYKWGGTSLYMDGVAGSKVTTPMTADLQIKDSAGFTVECWLWLNQINPSVTIAGPWTWATSTGRSWTWYVNDSGGFTWWYQSGATQTYNSSGYTIPTGEWVHVVAQSNIVTDRLEFFSNGVKVMSAQNTVGENADATVPFAIGSSSNDLNAWNGYIDDFRVTKGVARYSTDGFTPPDAPYPLA